MIASLRGVVSEKLINKVIIDVGGIGYGVIMTVADGGSLHTGQEAKVYIHEHLKEDLHDLYGFCNLATLQLFEQLLSVKNVGPKVALSVLDAGNVASVQAAIAGGDVKFLQSAKGVGKRAAEQMVVELRDKVGAPVGDAAEQLVGRAGLSVQDEATQALVALGYGEVDAQQALAGIDPTLSTEERIKLALKSR
jgi:Holliday junction DNA helicase RuvA